MEHPNCKKWILDAFQTSYRQSVYIFGAELKKKLSRRVNDGTREVIFYFDTSVLEKFIDEFEKNLEEIFKLNWVVTRDSMFNNFLVFTIFGDNLEDCYDIREVLAVPYFREWRLEEDGRYFQAGFGFLLRDKTSGEFHTEWSAYTGPRQVLSLDPIDHNNMYGKLPLLKDRSSPLFQELIYRIYLAMQGLPLSPRALDLNTYEARRYYVHHFYISEPLDLVPNSANDRSNPLRDLQISAYVSFSVT